MPESINRKFQTELGKNVVIPFKSVLKSPFIHIGDNTRINGEINIRGDGPCLVGKYCAIGYDVKIITSDHDYTYPNIQVALQEKNFSSTDIMIKKRGVEIGNNVWFGDNVIVLSNVKIGNGAVVGAGSVVTKDVPAFGVAVGNPAKIVKYRFSKEIIDCLENIAWWDWPEDKVKKNEKFFSLKLSESCVDTVLKSII